MSDIARWDERFSVPHYIFGEAPNAFLAAQKPRLPLGGTALSVADGEGRNGVWLAQLGLDVLSVDASSVAQQKARTLAARRGVALRTEQADITSWRFPEAQYDVVAGIFFQFCAPAPRARIFAGMSRALKPGGLLLIQGYRPEQLRYGTGGPKEIGNLYTEDLLRQSFADLEIIELASHDDEVDEGPGHRGMSALIDLVARRPV